MVYPGKGLEYRVVPDNNAVEKTIITLATINETREIIGMVSEFNLNNSEYTIKIKDYGIDGITKLLTEITSGEIPDIINLGGYTLSAELLVRKGYLDDLYPYLDNDQELSRETILPNLRTAFEYDGSLYEAFSSFRITTFIGYKETIDDFTQIVNDMLNLKKEGKEVPRMIAGYDRQGMLNYLGMFIFEKYIDWNTGNCQFDSDEFINILNYLSLIPEDQGDWSPDTIVDSSALLYNSWAANPIDISAYRAIWGDSYIVQGFPGNNGPSNYILRPETILSISSSSKHKDICWGFVRKIWLEDYQNDPFDKIAYVLNAPSNTNVFNERINNLRNMAETDELTSKVIGTHEVQINVKPDQEDIDEFLQLVNSTIKTMHPDEIVTGIVSEEAVLFFAGQITAEAAAEMIQSRVRTYVNEQKD